MGTKPHFYATLALKKETDLWFLEGSVDAGHEENRDAASGLRNFR